MNCFISSCKMVLRAALGLCAGLIASLTAKVVQAEHKSKIYFDFVEAPPTLAARQRSANRIQCQIYLSIVELDGSLSIQDVRQNNRGKTSVYCKNSLPL